MVTENARDQKIATMEADDMKEDARDSSASRGSHRVCDGVGCKCEARSEAECGCDADWTPQEVYDLRAENERLKEAIRRVAEQDATLSLLCKRDGSCVVTVTMDATLADEERARFRTALADAINRPMGVIPASAEGLVTPQELEAARFRVRK